MTSNGNVMELQDPRIDNATRRNRRRYTPSAVESDEREVEDGFSLASRTTADRLSIGSKKSVYNPYRHYFQLLYFTQLLDFLAIAFILLQLFGGRPGIEVLAWWRYGMGLPGKPAGLYSDLGIWGYCTRTQTTSVQYAYLPGNVTGSWELCEWWWSMAVDPLKIYQYYPPLMLQMMPILSLVSIGLLFPTFFMSGSCTALWSRVLVYIFTCLAALTYLVVFIIAMYFFFTSSPLISAYQQTFQQNGWTVSQAVSAGIGLGAIALGFLLVSVVTKLALFRQKEPDDTDSVHTVDFHREAKASRLVDIGQWES